MTPENDMPGLGDYVAYNDDPMAEEYEVLAVNPKKHSVVIKTPTGDWRRDGQPICRRQRVSLDEVFLIRRSM